MKTYKTSEVYKTWETNSKAKFKRLNDGHVYKMSKGGFMENTNGDSHLSEKVHEEWQLVQEPVTWQEAIGAWANGKTVECHFNEQVFTYCEFYLLDGFSDQSISKAEITKGTWYIKGDK